jgi:hypothetical protein
VDRKQLVELIVVRGIAKPEQLQSRTVSELEKILDDSLLAQVRAEAMNSPEIAESQKKIDEINADRQRMAQENQLSLIFRTPVSGRVAVDNFANRQIIRSWVDETKDEAISRAWFVQILKENPNLAKQLSWQSTDLLDPRKQKEAAAAQAEQDRETFNLFARENGFSEVEANYQLAKSVLGDGLDRYTLAQAVQSNGLSLAQASFEELAQFRQDAAEERQDWLINSATPLELRRAARYESEQLRGQQQRAARQVQIREQKEAGVGYPPLPDEAQDGQKIDRMFLLRLPKDLYARFCSRYGFAAITARLNEVR